MILRAIGVFCAMIVPGALFAQARPPAPEIPAVIKEGSRPSAKGPAEYFSGSVRIDPLFQATDADGVSTAQVTFEPGARSAWHTHPRGQILIVTSGCGWTQWEGKPVERMCAGDVAWVPANVRHWHGATSTTAVTHIAVTGSLDGKNVNWKEKVSDEHYLANLREAE